MKTIGLIDYYISEWHANNYPGWIREICKESGKDFCIAYAWAEQDTSPVTGETTDEWCARCGIEKCATIEELCEKADYLLILAPTNPEKHLGYAKIALTYGKPTYIDKTFAPDEATAAQIYSIAEKNGVPMFTTSALRYASELRDFGDVRNVIITGSGSNLPEYLIHLVEMEVILLGDKAVSFSVEAQGSQKFCRVVTASGKRATLVYSKQMPYSVEAELADGTVLHRDVNSDFFRELMKDILRFYETKQPSFPSSQTMEVMRVREQLLKADK